MEATFEEMLDPSRCHANILFMQDGGKGCFGKMMEQVGDMLDAVD